MRGWSDSVALTMWGGIGESVAIRVAVAAFPMVQPSDKALPRPAQEAGGRSQAVDPARRAIDEAMERYARGEVAAFDQLYGMAAPRVRGFLLRMCGNLALAEDLTQETFLRVSRARGSFEERAAAIPWILSIARNALFDHVRRARTRGEVASKGEASPDQLADPDTRGDEVLSGRELFDVVRAALDELTVQQREAFVLLRFEGMSVAEAAMVLGTTPGAVKIRAFRAYEALRAAIEKSAEIKGERNAR
ncbi:MAG: RNA polymerase sigma factor [Polyangiaceae bacterium]